MILVIGAVVAGLSALNYIVGVFEGSKKENSFWFIIAIIVFILVALSWGDMF